MARKNAFNTVTTFSKITALVLFVMFPIIGFYLGVSYQERIDRPLIQQTLWTSPHVKAIACTMEAKKCPNGSYVTRIGPKCEFAKCPGE